MNILMRLLISAGFVTALIAGVPVEISPSHMLAQSAPECRKVDVQKAMDDNIEALQWSATVQVDVLDFILNREGRTVGYRLLIETESPLSSLSYRNRLVPFVVFVDVCGEALLVPRNYLAPTTKDCLNLKPKGRVEGIQL